MKKHFLIILLAVTTLACKSQTLYFPPITGDTWDTISPASLGWCSDEIDTLLQYLEDKNSKAFIVLKDGKIVIEKYFGTFAADSAWYWASAGKTLTAFAVGMAKQDGYLSINDMSSDYLGEGWTVCSPEKEDLITVKNQLTMTSGLDDGVPDPYCTIDTCLQYLADADTRWAYHNGPYTLLDEVIQTATSQTLNSYINENIKAPTGMTGFYFPVGYNNIFFSNARSMARFGLLILNKGNWDGDQIMEDTAYFSQMISPSQTLNKSYGYLWWLNGKESFMVPGLQIIFPGSWSPHAPDDMIAALGKDGQFINVVESENLVFIRMGNNPGTGEVSFTYNDTIWQKLNEVMCDEVSVESISETHKIKTYPNPAHDHFTIALPQQVFTLTLFDITGNSLSEYPDVFDSIEIETRGLAGGIYFVRVVTADQMIYTARIVVIQ
ncbi:MAG: serine hydrolase [Chitinophagales bacterium]|nr:serine hydrolase [Chitinophagales bacterium]